MVRGEESVRTERVWAVIWTFLTFFAFQMKYDEVAATGHIYQDTIANLFRAFPEFTMSSVVLLVGVYWFYKMVIPVTRETIKQWSVILPAILFTMFMILGYSFEQSDGWYLVRNFRNGQIVKTAVLGSGYFLFFLHTVAWMYHYLDNMRISQKMTELQGGSRKSYRSLLTRYPFIVSVLTLVVFYIPYVVIFYPTIFQGDTYSQIVQGYQELRTSGIYYMTNERLLSQNVFINQHHPVVHTLLIHFFLRIGENFFHSLNSGIFLYSNFQWLFCIIVISYGVQILVKELKISAKYVLCVILYFIFSPRIQNYMFLVTKDVLYGMFFLLVMTALFGILYGQEEEKIRRNNIILAIASTGMVLFRNEAVYVLMASFLFMACLCKKLRKRMLCYSAGVLVLGILVVKVLFPILSFTPGSVREMLAVPFQQTARYVRDLGNEVTEEEEEAISAILDYSKLAEKYDPNNVDNVKATYNEDATKDELIRYFKTWFRMGLKQPSVYVQATINNYYRYFYPGPTVLSSNSSAWSEECMALTNRTIAPLGMQFSYPEQLRGIRTGYELLRDSLDKMPVFNILVNPAAYVWLVIFILFYGIRKKSIKILAFISIPCFTLLMRLLGPCNGQYCRYMYPIMAIVPFMIPMALFLAEKE